MEILFSNTSKKIKVAAKIILACALFGAIFGVGSLLIGVLLDVEWLAYIGLALVVDFPIAYLSALLIYGFAILVAKAESEESEATKKADNKEEEKVYRCPKCKNPIKYGDETCSGCGVTIKW